MLHKATLIATAFATLVFTTPTLAQNICGERSRFVDQLHEQYGEAPAAMGLASNGTVVEVMTSDAGSWTIIVTRPDGVSCVVASGESWEAVPKLAMGPAA